MFQWNEEKLRFMEDAAAWGDFHARLAAALAPYLPGDGHICDAGCGTGHLSLALSPYVRQVTAVDVSGEALALLAENCRKRHMTNITSAGATSRNYRRRSPMTPWCSASSAISGRF